MKKGLFITRGQPLHNGHVSAIEQAISAGAEEIILGIGSADKEMTQNNPFSCAQRVEIAQELFKELEKKHPEKSFSVHPIMDFGDKEQRKSYIESSLPEFDTIITGNPIVQSIWKASKSIFNPSMTQVPYRGTHIRHQIGQENWETVKESVPEVVVNKLRAIDAPRIMKSINKLQPTPIKLAADVIVMDKGEYVLIHRKYAPYGLAMAGGMMDLGESTRATAQREGGEELFDKDDPEVKTYITTQKPLIVLDDPERDPRAHTISFVYEMKIEGGTLLASDDADREKGLQRIKPEDLDSIPDEDFAFIDHKQTLIKHRDGLL